MSDKKATKDTGYKRLKRECDSNLQKWIEWMKRAQLAERKVEVLKSLVLLTHDVVSHVEMNGIAQNQCVQFLNEFLDEKKAVE